MELLHWIITAQSAGPMSWPLWPALSQTSDVSGPSGGDLSTTTVLWILLSGAGTTITTLAGLLYNTERKRRIDAERKLEKFQEIAPDLAESVRWLMEEAVDRDPNAMPWPVRRTPSARSPTRRRLR